jgi:hypothetical protein
LAAGNNNEMTQELSCSYSKPLWSTTLTLAIILQAEDACRDQHFAEKAKTMVEKRSSVTWREDGAKLEGNNILTVFLHIYDD